MKNIVSMLLAAVLSMGMLAGIELIQQGSHLRLLSMKGKKPKFGRMD